MFNKVEGVFDDYVKHFYNIKSTTTSKVEKAMAKSLLNNLLGRFGLDMHKTKTKLVDFDAFSIIAQTKEIVSVDHIGKKMLVTYRNHVSSVICEELGVDYKETVRANLNSGEEKGGSFRDVSIAIASAVTAYARIAISKAKLDIQESLLKTVQGKGSFDNANMDI